ncbi:MAG: large conductance mechanosensitive channel protein MscL [Rhodocyclaceae bacterium]|jgi:large conductance mechanosensitive channel|nr:large conductance mechanosensitive channel protein MscL [Rhodocyclaceae bacterium]
MSILSEFKEFAMKGNVVDLAVGVIIGTAFGKIVDSLVKDVVMPVIGRLLGGVDFKHLYVNLGDRTFETMEAAEKAGAPLVKYGIFINTVVDFVIIAFAIFMAIKVMNRLKRAEAAPAAPAAPATRECPHCLSPIPLKASRCPQCTSQLQ